MLNLREQIVEESDEDLIFITDTRFDPAIVGVAFWEPRVVYDAIKIVEILSEEMSSDDAYEYFEYNIAGARGDGFPVFINLIRRDLTA